jgi:tetrahydrodipicolinate N-succinyltransferase
MDAAQQGGTTLRRAPTESISQTEVESSKAGPLLIVKTNAATLGARVVDGIRKGVRALIDACVVVEETVRLYHDDRDAIDEFMAALVDGNIISKSEGRLGLASPKLSKFCAAKSRAILTP